MGLGKNGYRWCGKVREYIHWGVQRCKGPPGEDPDSYENRDSAVSELRKKHGDFGCGYPTDPKTIKFLETWVKKFGVYPDFVRKSWKPAKRIKAEVKAKQTKLV